MNKPHYQPNCVQLKVLVAELRALPSIAGIPVLAFKSPDQINNILSSSKIYGKPIVKQVKT